MRTKDLEGYIGYAEFGEGERLIMSLGHLDVVPVSEGWKHAFFGAEIDGGYIYSRYATDDNFTGQRIYDGDRCMLRRSAARRLINAARELNAQGFRPVIYDGYRPHSAQWKLWDVYPLRGSAT